MKRINKILKLIKNGLISNYYNNLKINEKLILLESTNGNDIAGNIFYTVKELSKERYSDYEVVIAIKKELIKNKKELLNSYGIHNIKFTEIGSLDYYKHLYTAKYLFNDATFPFTYVKKKDQIYLNFWHGTPLKRLGKANIKRGYALGNVQRNFAMADYLLYPNHFMEKAMIDSFMLQNLSNAKIINEGYPRNTIFFNHNAANDLKFKLNLRDKEVIVYMPTWRGVYNNLDIESQNNLIKDYLSKIDDLLSPNQILFVKLHSVVQDKINYDSYKNIDKFPLNFETYDILNMADCLITDYSSVFFDFACSKKKIILFVYDEEEYIENIGTYFPLNELPFPKVYTVNGLIKEINSNKNYEDEEFINEFCKYDRIDSTKYICEYIILNKDNNIKIKNMGSNGKEKVLIYVGSLKNNKITKRLIKTMKNVDLDERNYFLTTMASEVKENSSKLFDLSKFLDYIPIRDGITMSFRDFLSLKLFKHGIFNRLVIRQLNSLYDKNICKYYPEIKFDHVIHFTGFNNQMLNLFERFKCEKTVFIHENMVKEIKKGKIDKLTLKNAYDKYDNVFITQKELLKPKIEISSKIDNLILSNIDNTKQYIKDFKSIFNKDLNKVE